MVQKRLLAHLDGELDASASERVAAHLGGCTDCQDELTGAREFEDYLREVDDYLGDAPGLIVPPDFAARVVALAQEERVAIATAPSGRRRQWLPIPNRPWLAFTVAVIALAMVCGYQVGRMATPYFTRLTQPQQSQPGSLWELVPREFASVDQERERGAEKDVALRPSAGGWR